MAFEDGISEEEVAILPKDGKIKHQSSESARKGGLRTIPFIIVNESFEKVSSYGLLPNMIFYLMNGYHLTPATGSIILSLWNAASNFLAIFGAFLSDSYLGRFRVIALGTFASLIGTILLWSTAMFPWMKPSPCPQSGQGCESATPLQFLVLYTSFALISIGAGCVRPCSLAFGADQMNDKENPNNERVLDSFFNWYYASTGLSTVIALTFVVYIQDQFGWKIGFGVPTALMILSFVTFLLGSRLYVHVKVRDSLFLDLIQVPVAAFHKRKVYLPLPHTADHYFHGNHLKVRIPSDPSDNFRCLTKACLILDAESELNPDGSAKDPWSLSSVESVENLKIILRLFPMWSTGILMTVCLNNNYTTLQANIMNRHIFTPSIQIPAATFGIFSVITITFWVAFYDRVIVPVLAKYRGMPRGLDPKVRMGIGLALACMSVTVGGFVESIRRKMAIDEGLEENASAVVDMSAMWLAPQLVIVGLAEGFNAVGQIEFYYTHLSKSMSSIAMAIFTFGMAVSSLVGSLVVDTIDTFSSAGGNDSWLSRNLNKGHVDYYYWLIGFLAFLNFIYFLFICKFVYGPSSEGSVIRRINDAELEEDEDYAAAPSA